MALYLICMDTSEVLLKSKLTDFSSVKIRYRNEPWFRYFYMKMVLLEDVQMLV